MKNRMNKAVREQLISAQRAIEAVDKQGLSPIAAAQAYGWDVLTARRVLEVAARDYGTAAVLQILGAAHV